MTRPIYITKCINNTVLYRSAIQFNYLILNFIDFTSTKLFSKRIF